MIAVGVVEDDGAFKPDLLNRIYRITTDIEKLDGVIVDDILAPSTVDDIKQGSGGTMVIEPLMRGEISTQEEADYILSRIKSNPVLRGKLASDDGKAIALFIPIREQASVEEACRRDHRDHQEIWWQREIPHCRSSDCGRFIRLADVQTDGGCGSGDFCRDLSAASDVLPQRQDHHCSDGGCRHGGYLVDGTV